MEKKVENFSLKKIITFVEENKKSELLARQDEK